jgi:hypothetical protein
MQLALKMGRMSRLKSILCGSVEDFSVRVLATIAAAVAKTATTANVTGFPMNLPWTPSVAAALAVFSPAPVKKQQPAKWENHCGATYYAESLMWP